MELIQHACKTRIWSLDNSRIRETEGEEDVHGDKLDGEMRCGGG